jgi:hypothetical protein
MTCRRSRSLAARATPPLAAILVALFAAVLAVLAPLQDAFGRRPPPPRPPPPPRTSVNRNVHVNQNVHVNRNVHVDVDRGYPGYHPVAAVAATAATAAVIGSIAYSLPPACSSVVVNGLTYHQCGSAWYQPRYAGTQVNYVVVNPPR